MKGGDSKLPLVQISHQIVTQELKFSDNSSTLQIAQYTVDLRICATWFRQSIGCTVTQVSLLLLYIHYIIRCIIYNIIVICIEYNITSFFH